MPQSLDEIDYFSPAFLLDPHEGDRRLRETAPVWRDPRSGAVFVSSFTRIMEVNSQPLVYSNNIAAQLQSGSTAKPDADEIAILKQGVRPPNTLITADPPAHTRYRKLAMKAFTFKRVEAMGDYIAAVANSLIDGFFGAGACEFKSAFAAPLPMIVIADTLGVSRADMDQFFQWSEALILQPGGVADKPTRLRAARHVLDFQRYFLGVAAEKRVRPTDDVISDLVHADLAEEGDSRKLNDGEMMSILQQLLVAGNETTANALTAGLYYLITHPEQRARLAADPVLIDGLVDETVRYLSPASNLWRRAARDADLGGVPIKEGDLLLLRYGSANRDASQFHDPDAFDIARPDAKSHLGFGAGIHACLGAQLARQEMRVAFPILLDRLGDIRLRPGDGPPQHEPSVMFRGISALNVEFGER